MSPPHRLVARCGTWCGSSGRRVVLVTACSCWVCERNTPILEIEIEIGIEIEIEIEIRQSRSAHPRGSGHRTGPGRSKSIIELGEKSVGIGRAEAQRRAHLQSVPVRSGCPDQHSAVA